MRFKFVTPPQVMDEFSKAATNRRRLMSLGASPCQVEILLSIRPPGLLPARHAGPRVVAAVPWVANVGLGSPVREREGALRGWRLHVARQMR